MPVCGGLFNYLTQSQAPAAQAVQKLLAPLQGANQFSVYLSSAGKQAPAPYVVLHLLDGPPAEHTQDGPSGLQDGRFQFDSYGPDQPTARKLSQAVRDALKSFSGALNDGTTIQFYEVAMDTDEGYEIGGTTGYLFKAVLQLRAFYTELGQ
jgi:hypothetical protein